MMIEILKPASIVFGTFVLFVIGFAVCVYLDRNKNQNND